MKQSTKIIFLGLLSSLALIITCIYFKYDMVNSDTDKSINSEKTKIVEAFQVDTIPEPQVVKSKIRDFQTIPLEESVEEQKAEEINRELKALKVSSLDYKIEKELISIDGEMPILENNDTLKIMLMSRCEEIKCDKKIRFSSEQVNPKWKELATETIALFHGSDMDMAHLIVDGNSIVVSGEFKDKDSVAKLEKILTPYLAIYNIKNETTLKEKEVALPKVEKPVLETPKIVSKEETMKIVEDKISDILKEKHVNFYRNRAKITKKGQKTLDEIIVILKKHKDIYIEVQGHTDASGKAKTNQWISTQRAKSVKNYLGSRGLNPKHIVAKGFGETKLLVKNRPNSAINRRVEIKIKRR